MLRDYQRDCVDRIAQAWADGAANVMLTSPTGSGKTVVVGHIVKNTGAPVVVIAHRQELIGQMSLCLNRESVPHSIIAPKGVVQQIVAAEMSVHGYSTYDARAHVRVAGVDTLIKRDPNDRWFSSVQLAVVDEGHHVLKPPQKWGRALAMFPNARGLLVTAHAVRGDGAGLGRHADGVVDRLVIGPDCRSLIDRGMLVDYRLFCPPSDIQLANVHIGAGGEFNQAEVRAAVHQSSRIVGDVVGTYMRVAAGKLGLTFAVDIESAKELATAYRAAGVPAEIVTGETPLHIRAALLTQLKRRQIMQLVSVEVLGEGTDVPAVEVISMARPTASFQLFAQQTGRALRLDISDELTAAWNDFDDAARLAHIAASRKPKALIIDHVQNTIRHGLPDVPREYNLGRRERRSKSATDAIPLRVCDQCLQPFERSLTACPYCGLAWVPAGRGSPELVEGDIVEIDPAVLKAMRNEIARVDGPVYIPNAAPPEATPGIQRRHMERQAAQQGLRRTMALYGGLMAHEGRSDREGHKRFYFQFGVDVLTAQTLGTKDAGELAERVQAYLDKRHIVELQT